LDDAFPCTAFRIYVIVTQRRMIRRNDFPRFEIAIVIISIASNYSDRRDFWFTGHRARLNSGGGGGGGGGGKDKRPDNTYPKCKVILLCRSRAFFSLSFKAARMQHVTLVTRCRSGLRYYVIRGDSRSPINKKRDCGGTAWLVLARLMRAARSPGRS